MLVGRLEKSSLDKFQIMKKERVKYLLSEIVDRGGTVPVNALEGSVSVWQGINPETQDKYLRDLKHAGIIDVDNGIIILKWDKQKTLDWLNRNED